ncbi:MAG: sugar ABC transporter permease [Chloroflexaceae bacterium]|nr:sugar ABC transporter permease [Chloroflexaceae bacterium]
MRRSLSFWMLLPALTILLLFQVYPGLYAIYLALWQRQGGVDHFVGLRNFERLYHNPNTWESLFHSLFFTLVMC